MKKDITLGIIGTNFVSEWLVEAVSEVEGITAHAVYSRTAEKGGAFAEKYGIPNVFTSLEALLASDIDAVYIASPNCCHGSQAVAAAKSGKHILCEKPIAANAPELERMICAAKENGVVLLEAMRPAFDPAYDAIRSALSEIGTVRRAAFEYCQYSSRYTRYREGEVLRAFDPSYANAAIMDIGVYPLHVCLRLFGEPTGDIFSRSTLLPNGFEGSGEVILPYGDMTATVSYAKTFDSVNPSVIHGEDGAIVIDKLSCPRVVTLKKRGGEERHLEFPWHENNMVYELREFISLVEESDADNRHLAFSRLEMKLIDRIREQNGISFEKAEA